jgi:hypothetical protein
MRHSSRLWKFKVSRILNDSIVIAVNPPANAPAPQGVPQERVGLTVMFDDEATYFIGLEQQDQELIIPILSKQLPNEIKFVECRNGRSVCTSVQVARLLECSLNSLTCHGSRVLAKIGSSVDLQYLPVEFRLKDGRVFARGNGFKTDPNNREYMVDLPITSLVPISEPVSLDAYVFGCPVTESHKLEASDVGIMGYVDVANSNGIMGWVSSLESPEPLLVTLRVGSTPLTTTLAEQPRPDLEAWNIKNTKCGFSFDKETIDKIPEDEKISITIGDPWIHLVNSPCAISM